jgi:hypothetical protein
MNAIGGNELRWSAARLRGLGQSLLYVPRVLRETRCNPGLYAAAHICGLKQVSRATDLRSGVVPCVERAARYI